MRLCPVSILFFGKVFTSLLCKLLCRYRYDSRYAAKEQGTSTSELSSCRRNLKKPRPRPPMCANSGLPIIVRLESGYYKTRQLGELHAIAATTLITHLLDYAKRVTVASVIQQWLIPSSDLTVCNIVPTKLSACMGHFPQSWHRGTKFGGPDSVALCALPYNYCEAAARRGLLASMGVASVFL